MSEQFKGFQEEMFSPDEVAEDLIKEFAGEEENVGHMNAGNVGILQHDLDARVMTKLKSLEEEDRKGDAELLARHILFKLNSATFKGEGLTDEKSDVVKSKAVESLEKYLNS